MNYGSFDPFDNGFGDFAPSNLGKNAFGRAASGNAEFMSDLGSQALGAYAQREAAKASAQQYKKQRQGGGFLGGLLGTGATIASFIPGGQPFAAALGGASKLLG